MAYARLAIAGRLGRAASVLPVGVLEHALGAAQLSASAPTELSALRAALGSPAEEARWAAGGRAAFFRSAALARVPCARAAEGSAPSLREGPSLREFNADLSRPLGTGGHPTVYATPEGLRAAGAQLCATCVQSDQHGLCAPRAA